MLPSCQVLHFGLPHYSLKVTPGLKFLLRQADREFTESSFTMTFNVTTNGMDQNLADNSDVKIIMVNRKADLRISR